MWQLATLRKVHPHVATHLEQMNQILQRMAPPGKDTFYEDPVSGVTKTEVGIKIDSVRNSCKSVRRVINFALVPMPTAFAMGLIECGFDFAVCRRAPGSRLTTSATADLSLCKSTAPTTSVGERCCLTVCRCIADWQSTLVAT